MGKLEAKDIKAFNVCALAVLRGIPTPDGFTREEKHDPGKGTAWDPEEYEVTFTSEDIKIRMVHSPTPEGKDTYVYHIASGHTDFKSAHGWLTFDRHGIEDSFYVQEDDTVESATQRVMEQVQKCRDSMARHANTVRLPGIRFTCLKTQEQIAEITKKLRAGQRVDLAPSGMGQGVTLTTHRPRVKYGVTAAVPELKKLLGVDTLFLESFDHD